MESSATSDETLLSRYATGDIAAFEQLYARHELPLWRYILRHCGNRATADELMQEVWFAVTREAARFRTDARFTAWLYTIARNRAIDRHRGTRIHEDLDDQPIADDPRLSPPRQVEQIEQGQAILAALARLPAEQREAFVLQAETDMSVEEIASVTGTSFETAKSRLRYARDKLKSLLREYA
jgi:RNA polymerase sigma factor (sigma-70 family)